MIADEKRGFDRFWSDILNLKYGSGSIYTSVLVSIRPNNLCYYHQQLEESWKNPPLRQGVSQSFRSLSWSSHLTSTPPSPTPASQHLMSFFTFLNLYHLIFFYFISNHIVSPLLPSCDVNNGLFSRFKVHSLQILRIFQFPFPFMPKQLLLKYLQP